jgi:hypothetical protein
MLKRVFTWTIMRRDTGSYSKINIFLKKNKTHHELFISFHQTNQKSVVIDENHRQVKMKYLDE